MQTQKAEALRQLGNVRGTHRARIQDWRRNTTWGPTRGDRVCSTCGKTGPSEQLEAERILMVK